MRNRNFWKGKVFIFNDDKPVFRRFIGWCGVWFGRLPPMQARFGQMRNKKIEKCALFAIDYTLLRPFIRGYRTHRPPMFLKPGQQELVQGAITVRSLEEKWDFLGRVIRRKRNKVLDWETFVSDVFPDTTIAFWDTRLLDDHLRKLTVYTVCL